jgi:FMN phosphatase YigB (HAD superfamily)
MKIFLDFDDVMFHTKKFVIDYRALFRKQRIKKEIYTKYYYAYPCNKNKDFKRYDPQAHVKAIGKNFPINAKKIQKDIAKFIENTRPYVFPDVLSFFKSFSKKDLYLISFPKIKFQASKIKNSGLEKFFKQIILANEGKGRTLSNWIKKNKIKKEEKIYFIDDRLEKIEEVKEKNPNVITILLKRKEGRHKYASKGRADYVATNLRAVKKIVENKK